MSLNPIDHPVQVQAEGALQARISLKRSSKWLVFFVTVLAVLTTTTASYCKQANSNEKDYSSVDTEAFKVELVEGKDLDASILKKNGHNILYVNLKTSTIYMPFKSMPIIKSSLFGKTRFFIPKEDFVGILLKCSSIDKQFSLENTALYESKNYLNYVATSSEARVDIYTKLDGEITQVHVVYETKHGGMKEYKKFDRIFSE
jgi:hypothetical protein